ncbi:MAG: MraZ family transcriptional regulator [Fibrobacter sp.]|nr:MraZ family transcriptional regulator [Fibrobacter sp.]
MNFTYFIGQAQTAIDGKGRSAFPREFRRQLAAAEEEGFVVTRGPDRTLRLFVLAEYEKFLAELDARPSKASTPEEAAKIRRQTEALRRGLCATFVTLDVQNRLLFPKTLLEYAELKGDILYVPANGKTLELWNPDRYNEKFGFNTEESFEAFDAAFYGESLTEGHNDK